MIMDEHLAATREARQRQHAPDVTSRDDARRLHDAVRIQSAREANLTPAGKTNRRTNRVRGRWAQPSGWSVGDEGSHEFKSNSRLLQVFSGFFFAAGNKTLLRISRYPGEFLNSERAVGGFPIACCGSSGSCPP